MNRLMDLARRAGISLEWHDPWGMRHEPPAETLVAILAAMGLAAGTEQEVRDSLDALDAREWERALPPAVVVPAGQPGTASAVLPAEAREVEWRLALESGDAMRGTATWSRLERLADRNGLERRRLPLPALPMGYHRLEVGTAHCLVIATPDRCWLPPEMADGGRIWGIAAQLYGVRSDRNWGLGDFSDLSELVRRAAPLGVDAIGLNPVHAGFPEAPERFSPYAPSNRLFLNILYIDVTAVDGFEASAEAQAAVADPTFRATLEALREAPLVDWPAVAAAKRPVLEMLYRHFRRAGDRVDFEAFRARQGEALQRHAIFEALAEHFRAAPEPRHWWGEWPEEFRRPDLPAVEAFAQDHAERVEFFAWAQWQADRQLAAAGRAARRGGMALGLYRDLAVGSDNAGAEVWQARGRIATGIAVGAPPDLFNPSGQNWGLPPLDPVALQRLAYAPFIDLVRANMAHAGALRIDHAFGLARLFWIPSGRAAGDGTYVAYPLAAMLAVLKLESHRNRCLVIGEDLGNFPEGFSDAMEQAGLLSYRLLLFQRNPDGSFASPSAYPHLALCAASTHDLPTLAGWWEGHDIRLRSEFALYPSAELRESDTAGREADRGRLLRALATEALLEDANTAAIPSSAVQRFLARSKAGLFMVQLEDVLGLAQQANLPATTDQHPNWRRRLPVPVDQIAADDGALPPLARSIAAERPRRSRTAGPLARPRATYRVQLHAGFTFDDAAAIVPYLARLGVSHLYCSPYLAARPGSQHGYDIVDHRHFNEELGGADGYQRLVAALEEHGIGQLLDFVPNHMGVGGADNAWWLDVLEWGEASPRAAYFDIDWRPRFGAARGKLLLPILGGHYGEVLERGELALKLDAAEGSFSVWYYTHRLPVCPADYPLILEPALAILAERDPDDQAAVEMIGLIGDFRALADALAVPERRRTAPMAAIGLKLRLAGLIQRSPGLAAALAEAAALVNGREGEPLSFDPLDRLIDAQSYRVAYWRVAANEINYRRFFDVNDLAGLRMESDDLFERTHALVFEEIAAGRLHGLRIDHIDGLADPAGYCRHIQDRVGPGFYLVVEKILGAHERLRLEWPIHGTTGYEVLNQINGLFVDTAGERGMTRAYSRFAGIARPLDELLYLAKSEILAGAMASELHVLAIELKHLADADRRTRDYPRDVLRQVLAEVIAWFPVYRTYVTAEGVAAEDRQYIEWAVARAAKRTRLPETGVYQFLHRALLLELPGSPAFATKFQQLTGPVMAKGMEDTLFYRYMRLLSLNEVGGDPARFGISAQAFHHLNQQRAAASPYNLVATATHDTKRGEDVRARLNILSEIPAAWGARLARWARMNRRHRTLVDGRMAPSRNDEYLIYQTLLGSWPIALTGAVQDAAALDAYLDRVSAYLVKATREAKSETSWVNPDEAYEAALGQFVRRALEIGRPNLFLGDLLTFQARLARLGMVNGLSQTLLKLTIPGVPDIYQGAELWDLSLVDPDNRRPVDYRFRDEALAAEPDWAALLADWQDGRIKQQLVAALLDHRRHEPALYAEGSYEPVAATGERAEQCVAFLRRLGERTLLVAVPVLFARLVGEGLPLGGDFWRDTALRTDGAFTCLLTGRRLDRVVLADACSTLPVLVAAT